MKTHEVRSNTAHGPLKDAVDNQFRENRENYVFFCTKRVLMCGTIMYQNIMRFAPLETLKSEVEGKGGIKNHDFFVNIKSIRMPSSSSHQ